MKRLFAQLLVKKPGGTRSLLCEFTVLRTKFAGFLAVTFLAANLPAMAQRIDGLWDASVVVNGVAIPFRGAITLRHWKPRPYRPHEFKFLSSIGYIIGAELGISQLEEQNANLVLE